MKLLFLLGLTILSAIALAIEFTPHELYQQYVTRNYYTIPVDTNRNPASSARPVSAYKLYEQTQIIKEYPQVYKDTSEQNDPYKFYQSFMQRDYSER